eukprot:673765-Pelagomonas_calceolata.AAC.3
MAGISVWPSVKDAHREPEHLNMTCVHNPSVCSAYFDNCLHTDVNSPLAYALPLRILLKKSGSCQSPSASAGNE